ncbi:class I SAM-dependent methyltransferase [Prochlorothrix hollandica]|uniref:O-linked N-acetylglucosamine transferase family protein n=1 Tax=Prochlorothrix hollandica TaxID=1223 RepID=UPI00333F8965
MNPTPFLQNLAQQYQHWDTEQVQPKNPDFAQILAQVPGMTTANVQQLLNGAVAGLGEDEIYCEVGTYLGSTLIGALWQHPQVTAYAVDNFAEYNPDGSNYAQLAANLERFGLEDQVYFFDQDFEEFFADLRQLEDPPKIGVYFYDGAHDYRSTLMGLLLVTPFLADQALIILDDYNWQSVQQAAWDFMASHPQCQSLLELHTPIARYPTFWNGIHVLAWNRHQPQIVDPGLLQQKRQQTLITDLYNLQMQEQAAEQVKGLYFEAMHWQKAQEWDRAIEAYQRYLEQRPQEGQAWSNLGNLYLIQGEIDRARPCLQQAAMQGIEHPSLYLNEGNCLVAEGEMGAAIAMYRQGLQPFPDSEDLQANLRLTEAIQGNPGPFYEKEGDRHFHDRRYPQAAQAYGIALTYGATALSPPDPTASTRYTPRESLYSRLYHCLSQPRVSGDPVAVLREGFSRYPQSEELAFHLVTRLLQGAAPDALTVIQQVAQAQPDSFTLRLFQTLAVPLLYDSPAEMQHHLQRYRSGIQHLLATLDLSTPGAIEAAYQGINRFSNFYLTYQGCNLVAEQRQYGQLVQRIVAAKYPNFCQPLAMPPVTDKIRVGYCSHYLHSYSGTLWLTGWLKYADRSRFEIHCYYTGNKPDAVTEFFRHHSDHFHHFPDQYEATAQQIRTDHLHILVYPELGMHPPTIALAAQRLAPVQCTAWGHPLTSGLPTVDYYLSSELMDSPQAQAHYTETLIRLPHLGIAYPPPQVPNPLPKSRADFGLSDSDVVYLCCQAPFKYLPQYDYLLAAIAQAVPQAQFVFIRADGLKPRLSRAFSTLNLNIDDYCRFLPVQTRLDYLALNGLADVYLDTIGFTGGNMTLDALACGLPVVTLPTEQMRGRLSWAMLQRLDVTETIADNEAHYVDLAVGLGCDPQRRNALRQKISQTSAVLFDDVATVEALENFYVSQVGDSRP